MSLNKKHTRHYHHKIWYCVSIILIQCQQVLLRVKSYSVLSFDLCDVERVVSAPTEVELLFGVEIKQFLRSINHAKIQEGNYKYTYNHQNKYYGIK